jgi:hypothetical protein
MYSKTRSTPKKATIRVRYINKSSKRKRGEEMTEIKRVYCSRCGMKGVEKLRPTIIYQRGGNSRCWHYWKVGRQLKARSEKGLVKQDTSRSRVKGVRSGKSVDADCGRVSVLRSPPAPESPRKPELCEKCGELEEDHWVHIEVNHYENKHDFVRRKR